MTFSRFGSSGERANTVDFEDGVDVLQWKLYGKNKVFHIRHGAACKIQAFWRGCLARTATAEKIEDLIEEITAFRKLEAEYKKRDAEERRKCQSEAIHNHDRQLGLSHRRKKIKPWQTSTTDNAESSDMKVNFVTPTRRISRFRDQDQKQSPTSDLNLLLKSMEDDTRGYRRYRTNIHGKNKTRPWRDDTNVFDAF